MEVDAFADLLKLQIGLDVGSVGVRAIERAVQERRTACALPNTDRYWEYLQRSDAELRELIEAVIVSETWFFRDPAAFAALAGEAAAAYRRAPRAALRVLSIPCATGEEPYSIAITLLETGLPASAFAIDAVDISDRAIGRAQRGWYGKNSFRGAELGFRERHFEPSARGHQLSERVRSKVHFQRQNLFAADLLPGLEVYDVVFCRNLLIYLDADARQRTFAILRRLLKPTGLLFVGPAETGLVADAGFGSAGLRLAFALRKEPPRRAHTSRRPSAKARFSKAPGAARSPSAAAARAVARPAPTPARSGSAPAIGAASDDAHEAAFARAVRLADQGQLTEAAAACAEELRRDGPSAPVFHLLGLLSEASGKHADAASYHRKALYLDPHHEDALLHLALLLERQGDAAAARQLRQRVRPRAKP